MSGTTARSPVRAASGSRPSWRTRWIPCPRLSLAGGGPLWSTGPAFDQETRGTGASRELAFGGNNDGSRNIPAVNNEYANLDIICANRETGLPETPDDVRKGFRSSNSRDAQACGQW